MIIDRLKKLILPVRGSSKVEQLLVKETAVGSSPTPGAISRRNFFSFMGTGALCLAKPDLFLGQNTRFIVPPGTPNIICGSQFILGLRKEFAAVYAHLYKKNMDKMTFGGLMHSCSNLSREQPMQAAELDELYLFYEAEVRRDESWKTDKLVSQ